MLYTVTCKENNFTGDFYLLLFIWNGRLYMQIFNCNEDDKFNSLKEQYELTILYDYYSGLLKESQREILSDYYFNDLSLSEIADERGISRQGVHDTIKRCSKSLMEFEEILGLAAKQKLIKTNIKKIDSFINDISIKDNEINQTSKAELSQIKDLLEEIKDTIW